jgi:hypothetical protein
MIRETLEEGVDVVEIAPSDLDDPEAMKRISVKLRRRWERVLRSFLDACW